MFTGSSLWGADSLSKTRYFRPYDSKPGGGIAVLNAATFLPGVSPGALATVFGQNLTDVTGTVLPTSLPLPTQLANVTITVNGIPAPIFSITNDGGGNDQISFQVPYATPTGPSIVTINVMDYGNSTGTIQADSYTEDPGIFTYGSDYAVALLTPSYTLASASNPAPPGGIIALYVTGLGPLNANLQDGYAAPMKPLAMTTNSFQVNVNGEQCQVLFSGLVPGFVGLYQVNVQLPPDLPGGYLNLQITSQYASSNTVMLPVH